jgi:hypothetical protein
MILSVITRVVRDLYGVALAVSVAMSLVASAQTAGGIVMSGDRTFDCDSIASRGNQQRCWVSYPGARLCLNPSSPKKFVTEPLGADLALNVGGYLGTGVIRLPGLLSVGIADNGVSKGQPSLKRQTTWFPYKLGIEAEYPGHVAVTGQDFFRDAQSTIIRTIQVVSQGTQELVLTGKIHGSKSARWDAANQVLQVDDVAYTYALRFVGLKEDRLQAVALNVVPAVGPESWSLRIPLMKGTTRVAVGFGFAASSEGRDRTVERVSAAFDRPVSVSLAATKAVMDQLLRDVPKPREWGTDGLDPKAHRQAYYAAWAFLCQNCMDVQPEIRDYPYPQMTLGKPSLWAEGEKTCPATCGWESFLSLHWYSLLDPTMSWKVYEGIMSRVDGEGMLGGESLPSRKAQTAWILHQRKPDLEKLHAVYPALKRYLLWRERNLRWIYPGNDDPDEKDMEFAVSWLFDIGFAEKIAGVLGIEADQKLWRDKREPLIANMRKWFFSDPAKVHQFYFTDTGRYHDSRRALDVRGMVTTALCVKDLPADMQARMKEYFLSVYKPAETIVGFESSKYPDANLTAYGLIDQRLPEAAPYVKATLRDVIRAGDFAEIIRSGPVVDGVKPSVFNALTVIEFTWLLNGVRFESGVPVAFDS